jgi:hypothetical protein
MADKELGGLLDKLGITSRGGVASKIGDFPIEQVDAAFIRNKFVALFKRLLSQQGAK